MNLPTRTVAAALIAGSVSSLANSAGAVPLAASLSLRDASTSAMQTVRWWGWGGFGVGLAAGAIIGGALAAPYYGGYGYGGYGYYGYAPSYYSYGYYGGYAPTYYGAYTPGYYGYGYAYPRRYYYRRYYGW